MNKKSFEEGEIVFAKVKGYPPWPAKIIAVGKGRYPVLFYGTNESATCKAQDVFNYVEFKEKYGKLTKPAFLKAMKEAEEECQNEKSGKLKKDSVQESGSEDGNDEDDGKEKKSISVTRKKPSKKSQSKMQKESTLGDSESDDDVPLSKKVANPKKQKAQEKNSRSRPNRGNRKSYKESSEEGNSTDNSEKSSASESQNEGKQKNSHKRNSKSSERKTQKRATKRNTKSPDIESDEEGSRSSSDQSSEADIKPVARKQAKREVKKKTTSSIDINVAAEPVVNVEKVSENSPSKEEAGDPAPAKSNSGKEKSIAKQTDIPKKIDTQLNDDQDTKKNEKNQKSKTGQTGDPASDSEHSDLESSASESTSSSDASSSSSDSDEDDKKDSEADKKSTTKAQERDSSVTKLEKPGNADVKRLKAENAKGGSSSPTSSAEDDDVIHSSRVHKSHSRHTVLSESDSNEEDENKTKGVQKNLEQMLAERKREHQELLEKRKQEKMEERRQRQLQKQMEQEEEKRQKEEKKKQQQQQLKTEKQIKDLDDIIKRSLAVSTKDVAKCIEAMKTLDELELTASMLVKYPAIIDTIKKCRKYKADPEVMSRAETLCNRFKSVAASDKSAITALSKQFKSEKVKPKKEEEVSVKADAESPVQSEKQSNAAAAETVEASSLSDVKPVAMCDKVDEPILSSSNTAELPMDIDSAEENEANDHTTNIPEPSQQDTGLLVLGGGNKNVINPPDVESVGESISLIPGSVADLKQMTKSELPPEDVLKAGIQAIIAKTQESNALLEQILKQKKEKRSSSSHLKKRRKLDSDLPDLMKDLVSHHKPSAKPVPPASAATESLKKETKAINKQSIKEIDSVDDFDIDSLLGI